MNDAVTPRETIRCLLALAEHLLGAGQQIDALEALLDRPVELDRLHTGMKRHATAIDEPVKAIHTTDTADGTRAANAPKWSFANKNPKAELFILVSMAIVLEEVSPNPNARAPQ